MPRLGEMATFLVVLLGALLVSTMALTAALAGRGEQSAALSLRDDLTGAFNRRAFAQCFERGPRELRQLVEKEHAVVGQRDLAWSWRRTSAHECHRGSGMVGGPQHPL